jgi:eukaryotic-like serine/threonine-protein kinase
MRLDRAEVEQKRTEHLKRRRNIWLIAIGVVVLLFAFFMVFEYSDLIIRIPHNAQSGPQGSDWSMFRRDLTHSGNADNSSAVLEGTLAWTFTTGAAVHSSPAVVEGVVYFGSRDHNIYALDAATGEKKWAFETGSWVESSPIVVSGVVYCGSNDGNLYALNAKTGEKIWSFNTVFAVRSSPSYADGIVYTGSDDFNLYAIDAATGKGLWHKRTGNTVLSSPSVSQGIVIAGSVDGFCYSYSAKNGRPRLKFKTNASAGVTSSAAIKDGVAYFTDTNGYLYALDITKKNWFLEIKIKYYWNALYIYGVAPRPPKSSGFIWNYSLGFMLNSSSSPAIADNSAYLGAGKDMISLDITTQQVQWTFKTGDMVVSCPAVAGPAIYFGGEDKFLYAVDRATGTKLWDSALGDASTSSPAIANNMLYIGCDDGKLYAFK